MSEVRKPPRPRRRPLDEGAAAFVAEWYDAAMENARPWQRRTPALIAEIESEAHLALMDAAAMRARVENFPAFLNHIVGLAARKAIRSARPLGYRATPGRRPVVEAWTRQQEYPDRHDDLGRVELRDLAPKIAAAVARLPPRQAESFRSVCLDGASFEDAAAAMGVSVGTVSRSVHVARTRLRKAIARDVA